VEEISTGASIKCILGDFKSELSDSDESTWLFDLGLMGRHRSHDFAK
jgi:hypothetical protein